MFVTRFAPSPTGHLHLGHGFSALTLLDAAQAAGGEARLRIDDLDTTRCRHEFEASNIEDCAWLGFTIDEPLWRQSEREGVYTAALEKLAEQKLIYPCFKTRTEIGAEMEESIASAPHEAARVYVRAGPPVSDEELMERLMKGESPAWRLDSVKAQDTLPYGASFAEEGEADGVVPGEHMVDFAKAGDVILSRRDVPASYHLATIVDDAAQGVTHVIRGADLAASAHVQAGLACLLELPVPVYLHHRLIMDETGKRLAKRHDALALRALRDGGMTLRDMRARLGL